MSGKEPKCFAKNTENIKYLSLGPLQSFYVFYFLRGKPLFFIKYYILEIF